MKITTSTRSVKGQTMVELALVLPLFVMVFFGIIIFGIGVFYQQQIANAAREGARYAIVSSTTAQCPTVSHLPPLPSQLQSLNLFDYQCDPPPDWPEMTAAARRVVFGIDPQKVAISACWSGYVDPTGAYDAPATDPVLGPNAFLGCTMRSAANVAVDPRTNAEALPCPPMPTVASAFVPPTTDGDDKASSLAASAGDNANQVTVYVCYAWTPPLAGFLLIPPVVNMRAVVTEGIQHQQ